MSFIRFILECFLNALGYIVGDVYVSKEIHIKATHGIVGGILFVLISFTLIKLFCLDYEGYPKKDIYIPIALLTSVALVLCYLFIVYRFGYRE